jgi:hypothetical protein
MEITCQPTVMLRHLCARPATARMAQEREVLALRESDCVIDNGKLSEFHEVVAAAAGAQLIPGAILQPGGNGGDSPVPVHDIVLASRSKRGTHPEAGLPLERLSQTGFLVRQRIQ